MSGHTPGPWTYSHDTCAECERRGEAEYIIDGPPGARHGQFSHEPDARLIAAAPDMLEALKLLLADQPRFMAEHPGVIAARAAITKASAQPDNGESL